MLETNLLDATIYYNPQRTSSRARKTHGRVLAVFLNAGSLWFLIVTPLGRLLEVRAEECDLTGESEKYYTTGLGK